MPESIAAVGAFFASDAAAGAGAAAAAGAGAADVGLAGGAAAAASGAAGAGAAAAAGATVGGSVLGTLGTAIASGAASQLVGSMLAPKAPKTLAASAPLAMPDPLAQQQAIQQSIISQMSRRGRASTVMTDAGSGKLGG